MDVGTEMASWHRKRLKLWKQIPVTKQDIVFSRQKSLSGF